MYLLLFQKKLHGLRHSLTNSNIQIVRYLPVFYPIKRILQLRHSTSTVQEQSEQCTLLNLFQDGFSYKDGCRIFTVLGQYFELERLSRSWDFGFDKKPLVSSQISHIFQIHSFALCLTVLSHGACQRPKTYFPVIPLSVLPMYRLSQQI